MNMLHRHIPEQVTSLSASAVKPQSLACLLCCVVFALAVLAGCGADAQENTPPSSDAVQSIPETTQPPMPSPQTSSQAPTKPEPTEEPLPEGQLVATNELLLERFDRENPAHLEGRGTSAEEPHVNVTVRVKDPTGKPVPMLSCDYNGERMWTDSKGEVNFVALYSNPQMLSLVNGKSGLNIAENPDYWMDYRLTILEGAKEPTLELIWEGITPQQTIDASADRIEITVVDKNGKPVKGAKLWLEEALKEGELRPDIGIVPELTDENGMFIWCNCFRSDYNLSCNVDGEYLSERFVYTSGVLTKTLHV